MQMWSKEAWLHLTLVTELGSSIPYNVIGLLQSWKLKEYRRHAGLHCRFKNWSDQETGDKIRVQQEGYMRAHSISGKAEQKRNWDSMMLVMEGPCGVFHEKKWTGADAAQEKLHHAGSIGATQFLWSPDSIFNAYYGATVFGVCSDGSVLHWSALSLILKKKFLCCAIVYSCFWCSLSTYLRDCSLRRNFTRACGKNGDS